MFIFFWIKLVVTLAAIYVLVTLSILIHEGVHFSVAWVCGVKSRIQLIVTWYKVLFLSLPFPAGRLYPVGPIRPVVSIMIAISGPIANVCLAVAFFSLYLLIAASRIKLVPDADPLTPDLAILMVAAIYNAYSSLRNLIPLDSSDGALIVKSLCALMGRHSGRPHVSAANSGIRQTSRERTCPIRDK